MKKQFYFAHPRKTYNTQRERNALVRIKEVFSNCIIINPSTPKFQQKVQEEIEPYMSANEYITPFLRAINECSCLIFMPLANGKVGVGTFLEVRHSEACEIPVYLFDGKNFTTIYRLDECHTRSGKLDYADNWGIVTTGKTYAKGEIQMNVLKAEAKVERNRCKTKLRKQRK